jgi:signal transduction histidine kinase
VHDEHAWQRRISGADAYYGVVLAGTLAAVAVGTAGGGRVLALASVTAMAPWYAVAGRPVARDDPVPARVAWYLAGLAVLLAAAQAGSPWSSFMLLALCPQAFVLLRPRWATGVTAVFSLTPVLLLADHPGLALGAAGVAAGTVLFAATFGTWITRIIKQSRERADLIAALAAAQADLARAEHAAGALAERQRLATEIHDTLAQGFISILMLLQAADASDTLERARVYLGQASATARENLAEARGLIAAQPPAALDGSSLPEALHRLTGRVAEQTGAGAEFAVTGTARWLPSAAEVVVLRCAQEAVANVRKHAAADTVTLRLDYLAGRVRLRVSDDGAGFDPARDRGQGLTGMGNRVAQAGGTLDVRSAPGEGTTLTVDVPA